MSIWSRRARAALTAAAIGAGLLLAGCATVPAAAAPFSPAPSLQPADISIATTSPATVAPLFPLPTGLSAATPSATPSATSVPSSVSPSPSSSSDTATPSTSTNSTPNRSSTTSSSSADPCAPTDPSVVATCLSAPWGVAPLPDGTTALVGERTTGKVWLVGPQTQQRVVATISGIDATGDGGLLGLALSPYYSEDGLIYAYITTATDNRIVRFALGQTPQAIFTGIPKGSTDNGGAIAFGPDDLLYVATGDVGQPALAAKATSLAGKILRLDTFGHPASQNPSGTAILASGLTDPTGGCLVGGQVAVVDHRAASDVLLPIVAGRNYTTLGSGTALWTYAAGGGGATDCAVSSQQLITTSLTGQDLTVLQLAATGGFTGNPQTAQQGTYGRLRTIAAGTGGLLWLTTSNKDGHGRPIPSDDRVIVLSGSGGGGSGGGGGGED